MSGGGLRTASGWLFSVLASSVKLGNTSIEFDSGDLTNRGVVGVGVIGNSFVGGGGICDLGDLGDVVAVSLLESSGPKISSGAAREPSVTSSLRSEPGDGIGDTWALLPPLLSSRLMLMPGGTWSNCRFPSTAATISAAATASSSNTGLLRRTLIRLPALRTPRRVTTIGIGVSGPMLDAGTCALTSTIIPCLAVAVTTAGTTTARGTFALMYPT
jgi:hypothetical protein